LVAVPSEIRTAVCELDETMLAADIELRFAEMKDPVKDS
jgi:hypothetical protein